jgi:hypothetical protein
VLGSGGEESASKAKSVGMRLVRGLDARDDAGWKSARAGPAAC